MGELLLSTVSAMIKTRETAKRYKAFYSHYARFFDTNCEFRDFVNHVLGVDSTMDSDQKDVMLRILNKQRYPEVVAYLDSNVIKQLRKLLTTKTVQSIDNNDSDSISMESSSVCGEEVADAESRSSCSSSTDQKLIELKIENDRLLKLLSENKELLLTLVDNGWKPFIKSLIEKKM